MVMAIEQVVSLRELTIEDLCGRLLTAAEGYDLGEATDGVDKLLLTEEERSADAGPWYSSVTDRGDQRVLGDVNFIPNLRNIIIFLGQLDQNGCKIT
jgi:hypothetical protein